MSTVEPGWLPDPMGRHEFRWWDGTTWSDIVADQGVETVDRLDAYQPAAPVAGQQPQALPPPNLQPQPQLYPQPPAGAAAPAGPASPGSSSPGMPPSSSGSSSGRQVALVAGLAAVALIVVGAVAVAVNRGGGSDGEDAGADAATAGDPRDALIAIGDLPDGWREAEVPPGEAENVICEPGIDADAPREAEAVFERGQDGTWLSHIVMEVSAQQANDIVEEHERQVGQCGTFEDVNTVEGETWRSTITPEELTGPAFGDQTLWYVLHTQNETPNTAQFDLVRCLDRHDGVLTAVTLSVPAPYDDGDLQLVEGLARTASERLDS